MSAWNGVRKAIDAADPDLTARLVTALDEPGRREVAAELPGALRAALSASQFGVLEQGGQEAFLLAGAGTIGGAAAAATWLCRRDLRIWWARDGFTDLGAAVCAVTADRPDAWRAEVGRRVAARLSVSEETWFRWHLAAALTRSAGAPPPESDGFVVGWAAEGGRPGELAEDPFLESLVPRLFEVDGVGAALAVDVTRGDWNDRYKETWAGSLASLARTGRLERERLLDGCVSRFLRGGTANDLRWFVRLHTELDPTEDEAAARVRDYVRLLPVAPSTVAGLALQQVRRADDLGRLDAALFDEAAGALLFRPEKKLLRATLTWLDRTARRRDRADATLRAVTGVFTSEALDLRERAVKIAARHASHASGPVRREVRDAAAGLPADLRTVIAEAYGEVAAPAGPEPLPLPPPFVPRESPAPIGSRSELAEEFTVLLRSPAQEWRPAERFLAALIEFAHADADATREALRGPAAEIAPGLLDTREHPHRRSWVEVAVGRLFVPDARPAPAPTVYSSQMERFLYWRFREIGADVGRVPVLLATPTEGSGHIDPDVLLRRLERLEKAGVEPARPDLVQAILRLPREIGPSAAARATALTSGAGRSVASWLAEGDSDIARLGAFPEEGRKYFPPLHFSGLHRFWPSILPSHREITAGWFLPHLEETADFDWGQGAVLHDLAEAEGPTGAATGALLAHALANRNQQVRTDAVEAFLVFSARDALPAGETGTALGRLAALPRTVKALTAAADAGAAAEVWATLLAALPHVLPGPGEPTPAGTPALLTLATRLAETTGAKGAIPAVADVASRGGSSRLVKEAARLHRALAT